MSIAAFDAPDLLFHFAPPVANLDGNVIMARRRTPPIRIRNAREGYSPEIDAPPYGVRLRFAFGYDDRSGVPRKWSLSRKFSYGINPTQTHIFGIVRAYEQRRRR